MSTLTAAMPTPVQARVEEAAHSVHALLSALDAHGGAHAVATRQRARDRAAHAIDGALRSLATVSGRVGVAVKGAVEGPLRTLSDALGGWPADGSGAGLSGVRAALIDAYQRLRHVLEGWDVHVPALRPTNYWRNAYHVANGVAATAVLALAPPSWILPAAAAFAGAAWSMEASRRLWPAVNDALMQLFAPVAHPHEAKRVNSATWYATSLLLLAWMQAPVASGIGLLVLAVGDPAAAIVGRRWGRLRLANGRSVEGSVAFVAAGFVGATVAALTLQPDLGVRAAIAALAGAIAGAAAEQLSRKVDDNLTIPLSAALVAQAVLGAL